MRLLVSGHREYHNKKVILEEILKLGTLPTIIIHGDCSGVDKTAGIIAGEQKWAVVPFPADWSCGRWAGPRRNEQMIVKGKPDYAILFMAKESRGTKNMAELLVKYKIPHTIVEI